MKIFIVLMALISFSVFAGEREQNIDRDLTIAVSQLNLLLDKDVSVLLQGLSEEDQVKFERAVYEIKSRAEKLTIQFADKGRFPNGGKTQNHKRK